MGFENIKVIKTKSRYLKHEELEESSEWRIKKITRMKHALDEMKELKHPDGMAGFNVDDGVIFHELVKLDHFTFEEILNIAVDHQLSFDFDNGFLRLFHDWRRG